MKTGSNEMAGQVATVLATTRASTVADNFGCSVADNFGCSKDLDPSSDSRSPARREVVVGANRRISG